MQKPKIAISIGDINGVGPEIAMQAHDKIKEICEPVYCVPRALMDEAALKLGIESLTASTPVIAEQPEENALKIINIPIPSSVSIGSTGCAYSIGVKDPVMSLKIPDMIRIAIDIMNM